MPAVLVHGVPETPEIWDDLRTHLQRPDVVALQLPGFGCARPEGFGATKEEYVDWLVGELDALEQPVDLVGHDWGGGFTVRLVSTRPDLVRSWVTDAAGIGDVEFEWHQFARIWQTPGEGEAFWDEVLAQAPEERPVMKAADRTMAGCILDLYRSAVDVGKEWSGDFRAIPKPGMVLVPTADPFLSPEGARRAGELAGARIEELDGVGHWWMTEAPEASAAALERFWAEIGSGE
jgi:pimeloyl-ACP methyl ester carboxylesterase